MSVKFSLNGSPVTYGGNTSQCATEVLRKSFACVETMWGCDVGLCASCQIVVDGQPTRSCQIVVEELDGKTVLTAAHLSEAWFEWMTKMIRRNQYCSICLPGRLLGKLQQHQGEMWMQAKELTPEMESEARSYLGIPHCQCGEYRHIKPARQAAVSR